ncbi:MAG: hypothetical protein ICV59_09140 [Thermoleophilia bacterium]|nr:hypothetical protein [Thermoleophilia bacterium]
MSDAEPLFSISQITTLPQPFDEDLRTYAAAGADGIGIWDIKLPDRPDAETRERVQESGLAVTNCIGAVPSILPLPLLPVPRTQASASRRTARRSAGWRGSSPTASCS